MHLYARACARQVKAWELRAITDEELWATLYDIFVISHIKGEEWDTALHGLPTAIASNLLAYVRTHEPRVIHPRPSDLGRRAAQDREAVVAQKKLIARLEEGSR